MSCSLYVSLPCDSEITLENLVIYFQSTKSGGGDVDADASRVEGDKAIVVFEKREYLESVLQKKHEIDGYNLEISGTRFKPVPKKRTNLPTATTKEKIHPSNGKAYLGEVRTVIVSGICPDTPNQTLEMFFESPKRSRGGDIEKLERCQPDVAHITFVSAEVASNVLKQDKLEVDGYLLQLKEKQPQLVLPLDMKKLYVENIDPKTTEDSLTNYIELITRQEVCDVQFGENKNALITLNDEPDMLKVQGNSKPLEGAVLKFTNPPVCNSILITGLTTKTTKQAIEMYFENEKNGGGKIYGDIIYQKDKGKAVVSFCDPDVIQTLCANEQKLHGAMLSLHQQYTFMRTMTDTAKIIKVDPDVLEHVKNNCEKEFRDLFGIELPEAFDENKKELTLPNETAENAFIQMQGYMDQFAVEEILLTKKILDYSKEELKMMLTKVNIHNCTIAMEEELLRIKLVGNEKDVNVIYEQCKNEIAELEKKLNIHTEKLTMSKHILELFLLHGIDEMLTKVNQVEIKIEPNNKHITIKGTEKQVFLATKTALEKCAQIIHDHIDLNERKRQFLESGGLDMLNIGIKANGLKGMVALSETNENKAEVLVFDSATVEDIHLQIRNNMYEKQFSLDEDSLPLLKSSKWEEFYESVAANTSVMICTSSRSSPEISLIGKKSEVEQTYVKLQEFMRRNTIGKVSVDFGKGNTEYMSNFRYKDIQLIERELVEHLVTIHLEEKEIIHINGTKEGIQKAKKQLQEIASNTTKGTICCDKLRTQNYLESEQGKLFLDGIESRHKCVIRLAKDEEETTTRIPSAWTTRYSDEPTSTLLCSYETREKISIKVFKANITAHKCDVIVNAANGDLQHIGGVAKSILDAGGKEIQEECDAYVKKEGKLLEGENFSGSPGNLPCKRLIHAVGPRWDHAQPERTRKTLRVTCMRVLEEAMSYRSIGLPAIGSGVFGIPKEVCADVMIEVAEKFSKEHDDCSLKEIHFVNNDDASGQVFVNKFRERFGGRSSFNNNEAKVTRNKFSPSALRSVGKESRRDDFKPEAMPRRKGDDFIVTKGKMKISVVVGDLSTYKADVLVNTTRENLQLNSNPCGRALSNKAGPVLQAECNKIGMLNLGQVAATQGGNLLCDEVYHVLCAEWNGGQGEQVLRSIIKNCLKNCNRNGKKSIAFPAIGTGILGFPHDEAAKIFFEETKEFERSVTKCSINDVSFVVFNKDATSIQAFKNELKKQAEWRSSGSSSSVPVASEREWRRNRDLNIKSIIPIGEDKEVEIVKGDITKETTDVIAHLTNPGLMLQSGVGMALSRAGGKEIERACEEKAPSKFPETVLTTAGRLKAKYVAHMVASNGPTTKEIEKCIENCLRVATKEQCESISFPAVGTGILNHDHEEAAATILKSILGFLESSPGTMKTVRIVLNDDDLVAAFQASAKQLNEEKEPGVWKKFVNLFWKTDSSAPINPKEKRSVNTKKLFVEIFAKDVATVDLAKENIQKTMDSHKKKEPIVDENIGKLSKQQITLIKHLCEMNEIKVTIEKELNRIVVVGHIEDVLKTKSEIFQILKNIGEAEKEKEKAAIHADLAEIVSQGVQWFCINPKNNDHEEYDKQTNAFIEKAYSKHEKSVIFALREERCEIVFDKMVENNLKTNESIDVIRKDLKADVSVPGYWEPQPRDPNGKELTVHIVRLNPNQTEYTNVSGKFSQTSNLRIRKIERIQNPSLFKLYATKKQSLDERNGSNEQFLFHGTRGDKTNEINEMGLNRSYAGNTHGAIFGKGVYFARDASMSVGYAHPDTSGKRYMYLTRVALGQYTNGSPQIVVPPFKGGNSSDSYDSVVNDARNPTIFVLFYDNQYYPEYLITFA